jgi:hypothetical protein
VGTVQRAAAQAGWTVPQSDYFLQCSVLERLNIKSKRYSPELLDHDDPEWTARLVKDVLPKLFGAQSAKVMHQPHGRLTR